MLPGERQTALRFIRRLQPLVDNSARSASRLVSAVLHQWQGKSYERLAVPSHKIGKTLSERQLVGDFSEWLATQDVLTGAFWLSSAYACWVGDETRTTRAMFFTPPTLSFRLVDNLVHHGASLTQHVWLDPASGGAAFLAPVAIRMAEALRTEGRSSKEILDHISRHLRGIDIDPTLAWLSQQFLRMVLCKEIQAAHIEPDFDVTIGDALDNDQAKSEPIDVVLCNPPYRKMSSTEVSLYRETYGDVMVGQPNIYSLFFKLALDKLTPEGVAGLLTPTSYLSGSYFAPLRKHVVQRAEVLQLDIIGATRGFVGVTQETAIAVMKSTVHRQRMRTTQVFVTTESGFVGVGGCRLPSDGRIWPVPRNKGDTKLLKAAMASTSRIGDYGYVVRVGAYVWNRDKRKTYQHDPKLNRGGVYPLIWSSDIRPNGQFSPNPSEQRQFVKLGNQVKGSVVRRSCAVLQRVTSTEQPRRLVGAPIPMKLIDEYDGVVGENHVVFLEQEQDNTLVTPAEMVAVLATDIMDRLFRCLSGAVNVSIYELSQLPMPQPERLRAALDSCESVDEAVNVAFSIQVS